MGLLVVAYPNLKEEDYNRIQQFRKKHDELYYSIIEPHFTIVFPVFDSYENEFINEIEEKSKDIKKFNFTIRCATINKDAFSEYYHIFLVPDEGYSHIVKLHDVLYSELLFKNLRLDIDFIPHIGIGNSKNKYTCKKLADQWNSVDFSISGSITKLTAIEYSNNRIKKLHTFKLQ